MPAHMPRFLSLLLLISIPLLSDVWARDNPGQWKIIHAGKLLSVPGEPVKTKHSVVINNQRISGIYEGYVTPDTLGLDASDAEIIDLVDEFVLPGLIDVHTHLTINYPGQDAAGISSSELLAIKTEAELALNGAYNARRTLDAGFTTVRNVGSYGGAAIALRDAIDEGKVPGPRMFVAGAFISITSGHGDLEIANAGLYALAAPDGVCDGKTACRSAIRRQVRRGADFIKIMATGGGSEDTGGRDSAPEYSEDEMRDMVVVAHNLGRKVAAHAHGTRGIIAALKAGVDSVEHATYVDGTAIDLFKETGAYLVPTLSVMDIIRNMSMPSNLKARVDIIIEQKPGNIRRAYEKGVNIALGTDAGVIPHGSNASELLWFTRIGMSEMDAIRAATINAAELIGVADKLGTLETGKLADIIATDGNPLAAISALQDIDFVMKDGRIFKR